MVYDGPELELSENDDKQQFPWVALVAILAGMTFVGAMLIYAKTYHGTAESALEQQLTADKAEISRERDKVFELTRQVDALKEGLNIVSGEDRKAAVAEYNSAAGAQKAQHAKVAALMEKYNAKVAKLQELR
jgi:hypothetical protein